MGKKRLPMKKTIGKSSGTLPRCRPLNYQNLPEEDICLQYGLDSPVHRNDERVIPPKYIISSAYGLDCGTVRLGATQPNELFIRFINREATRAMDDKGRVFYTSFTVVLAVSKTRRKLLLEAWPMVQSSLKSVGMLCSLYLVNSMEKKYGFHSYITFSTTLSSTVGPHMIDKAMDLLEMLTLSDTPPLRAIQILDGTLQYDIIRIGISNGGFGLQLPSEIQQGKSNDARKSIYTSKKELQKISQSDIFLNVFSVVALGNSQPRLKLVRYVVKACFFSNLKPKTMIRALNYFCQNGGKLEYAEMNILGSALLGSAPFGPRLNSDGMLVCGAFFSEDQGKLLGKAWPLVRCMLEEYGISSTIYLDEGFMTISVNKDRDIIHKTKARDVFELLASTAAVPWASLLLTHSWKHDIIKIGYQIGGLGRIFNLNEKQFIEQTELIWAYRKDLEKVTGCDIYIDEKTVAALASEPEQFSLVRNLVTRCIIGMEDPAIMIEEIELEPEKKKQKV